MNDPAAPLSAPRLTSSHALGARRESDPGKGRHVIGGTAFGADEALLLVKDVKADPLEPRAKEIHRLNLKSGKGELWVRLPDDLFVSDIDWIDELDANDQMRTIK